MIKILESLGPPRYSIGVLQAGHFISGRPDIGATSLSYWKHCDAKNSLPKRRKLSTKIETISRYLLTYKVSRRRRRESVRRQASNILLLHLPTGGGGGICPVIRRGGGGGRSPPPLFTQIFI